MLVCKVLYGTVPGLLEHNAALVDSHFGGVEHGTEGLGTAPWNKEGVMRLQDSLGAMHFTDDRERQGPEQWATGDRA